MQLAQAQEEARRTRDQLLAEQGERKLEQDRAAASSASVAVSLDDIGQASRALQRLLAGGPDRLEWERYWERRGEARESVREVRRVQTAIARIRQQALERPNTQLLANEKEELERLVAERSQLSQQTDVHVVEQEQLYQQLLTAAQTVAHELVQLGSAEAAKSPSPELEGSELAETMRDVERSLQACQANFAGDAASDTLLQLLEAGPEGEQRRGPCVCVWDNSRTTTSTCHTCFCC